MLYPEKVSKRAMRATMRDANERIDAEGVAANFECGSYVRFHLSVDDAGSVGAAGIRSNGCGYMLAAAEVLSEYVTGRELTDLHGLPLAELRSYISTVLGELPYERQGCAISAIEALRSAFSDLRSRRVKEFRGEEALICTCFGVTQQRIEILIDETKLETVEEVTGACNAGTGCGSCKMLIQEMLDNRVFGPQDRL